MFRDAKGGCPGVNERSHCERVEFGLAVGIASSRGSGLSAVCRERGVLKLAQEYLKPAAGIANGERGVLKLIPGWQIVRLAGMIAALRISVAGMDASPPHRRRRGVQG